MRRTLFHQSRRAALAAVSAGLSLTVAVMLATPGTALADTFGPFPPPNAYLGPPDTATVHADTESSDTTALPGPGAGPVNAAFTYLASACPTILQGTDGMPQALCTSDSTQVPTAELLDPMTAAPLASLTLARGSLLGGVYAYIDNNSQMVVIDGNDNLLRIAHDQGGPNGTWRLFVASSTSLQQAVTAHCGQPGCDFADSLMPDQEGRVWFATEGGVVGVVDPSSGSVQTVTLPAGESIENSISTAPEGTAVATTQALYLLTLGARGAPTIAWRQPYDRGPARKPGQLSYGTGASPTFFGPNNGATYVAITDNAVPQENLLVYNTASGNLVCSVAAIDGTENAPVGSGNSVFVASTYGYPYPVLPANAGPSQPSTAPFVGGMTRVDVNGDGTGCAVRWTNSVRSAAVPRLSAADGKLYTISRIPAPGSDGTSPSDGYDYTVVDAATGQVQAQQPIGAGERFDPLQTDTVVMPGQVLYQGTVTGVFRIAPS